MRLLRPKLRRSRRSIPDTQSTHSELPSHPFPSPVDATLAYASRNKAGAPSLQRGLVHRNRRRTTFEHRSIEVRRRRLAVQGHYSREHKQQDGPHQSPRDAAGVAPGARRAASLGAGHALRGVGAVGVAPDPRGRAVLGRRPDPGAHLEGREPRRPRRARRPHAALLRVLRGVELHGRAEQRRGPRGRPGRVRDGAAPGRRVGEGRQRLWVGAYPLRRRVP